MANRAIETEKRVSWNDRLNAMSVNESMPVAFKSANTVRHAIWKIQKLSTKKFETKMNGEIVFVIRKT